MLGGSASRASGGLIQLRIQLLPEPESGWKETSGAQQWHVDNYLTTGRGILARRVCRFPQCKCF